jgi:hypothetical protein
LGVTPSLLRCHSPDHKRALSHLLANLLELLLTPFLLAYLLGSWQGVSWWSRCDAAITYSTLAMAVQIYAPSMPPPENRPSILDAR